MRKRQFSPWPLLASLLVLHALGAAEALPAAGRSATGRSKHRRHDPKAHPLVWQRKDQHQHVPKAHPPNAAAPSAAGARQGLSMRISQQQGRPAAAAAANFRSAIKAVAEIKAASSRKSTPKRGCRAMEERSVNGTCSKASELPDWCLPPFEDMSGVELMADARRYIRSLNKTKFNFVADTFRNLTAKNVKAFEKTHWLHNRDNRLGLHSLGFMKPRNSLLSRRSAFPQHDLPSMYNFSTCAVVGSARMMLAKPFGAEIDAHNVIFRSNQAPTLGFQRYVGSRTDIRIVNPANSYFSEDGPKTSCLVPIVQKELANKVIISVHKEFPAREKRCRTLQSSPQLEAYRWTTLVKQNKNEKGKAKMSSGFLAIAMAVQLCEKVNIYGYSFQGNYYFAKVHNGSKIDKATGKKIKKKAGEQIIFEAVEPPKDAGWGAGEEPEEQQPEAAAPGGRRRLQAIARNGHPWDAEQECTGLLSGLPNVHWHQDEYQEAPDTQSTQA